MNARKLSQLALCAVFAALGVVALLPGSALAGFTGYSFVDSFGTLGVGAGSFSSVEGVAVDQSTGDVLVLDVGAGSLYRFSAAGEPAEFPAVKADVIEGVGGAGEGLSEIAVDNSAGPTKGDIYIANAGALLIYNAEGEKLGELTEQTDVPWGIPCGVTVDAVGDVYVGLGGFPGGVNKYVPSGDPVSDGDYVSSLSGVPLTCAFAAGSEGDVYGAGYPAFGGPTGVARYTGSQFNTEGKTAGGTHVDAAGSTLAADPFSGDLFVDEHVEEGASSLVAHYGPAAADSPRLEVFGQTGQPGELTGGSYGVAVNNSTGTVYVSQGAGMVNVFAAKIVPDVLTGLAPKLAGEAATLIGTVNPDGTTLISCEFEYGTQTGSYSKTIECSPNAGSITGSEPVPVTAHLTGLERGVLYHFRLSAGNSEGTGYGQDQVIEAPPIIESESAADVGSDSATLQAQVNPAGTSTTYRFEYDTSEYTGSATHGTSVPLAGLDIGSGTTGVQVSIHTQTGLLPGTIYHYRVVASNAVETSYGPDEQFRTQRVGVGFALPDGREWELVSPAEKHGAEALGIGGYAAGGVPQASEDGSRVTYVTNVPFSLDAAGHGQGTQVISTRGPNGWTSHEIATPNNGSTESSVGKGSEYKAFSSDLSLGLLEPDFSLGLGSFSPKEKLAALTPLTSEAPKEWKTLYLRDDLHGGYQTLITASEIPSGAEGLGPNNLFGIATFEGASPALNHVVFSANDVLTPGAVREEGNLYDASGGRLQQVNILPGAGGPTVGRAILGGSSNGNRGAVSNSGRVIWTYEPRGTSDSSLFVRDMATGETVQADASQGSPDNGANGELDESGYGEFEIAASGASKVFFRDYDRLTVDSTSAGTSSGRSEGGDLYEYDVNTGKLFDLTVDPHPATDRSCPFNQNPVYEFCGANVLSVAGVSEDGSYVYFVADGVLAPGASPGGCRRAGREPRSTCNLYMEHYNGGLKEWEKPVFIATLWNKDEPSFGRLPSVQTTARVSPSGRFMTFMSARSLTGYDNRDAVSGEPDAEVYLFDASRSVGHDNPLCVSCIPTGERPMGELYTVGHATAIDPEGAWYESWVAGAIPSFTPYSLGRAIDQSRFLSDEGRLFFESSDALVPEDVNGRVDVYEFEPLGVPARSSLACSTASATFNEREGGCVSLISAGTGGAPSTFIDASTSGNDVFFVTQDRLVGQDIDHTSDVYDAHVCSEAVPCSPRAVVPPPCSSGDGCRPAPSPQPAIFGAPASATFSGAGNIVQSGSAPAVKKKAGKRPKVKRRQGKRGSHGHKGRAKRTRRPFARLKGRR